MFKMHKEYVLCYLSSKFTCRNRGKISVSSPEVEGWEIKEIQIISLSFNLWQHSFQIKGYILFSSKEQKVMYL